MANFPKTFEIEELAKGIFLTFSTKKKTRITSVRFRPRRITIPTVWVRKIGKRFWHGTHPKKRAITSLTLKKRLLRIVVRMWIFCVVAVWNSMRTVSRSYRNWSVPYHYHRIYMPYSVPYQLSSERHNCHHTTDGLHSQSQAVVDRSQVVIVPERKERRVHSTRTRRLWETRLQVFMGRLFWRDPYGVWISRMFLARWVCVFLYLFYWVRNAKKFFR